MANKRITDRGLLIYYTSQEEISKIDNALLGDLIKKELAWMSGKSEEPVFDDVRCDILHMHLKEQITVRDIAAQNHNQDKRGGDTQQQCKEPIRNISISQDDIERIIEEKPEHPNKYSSDLDLYKFANEVYDGLNGSSFMAFEEGWRNYFGNKDEARIVMNELLEKVGEERGHVKHITL